MKSIISFAAIALSITFTGCGGGAAEGDDGTGATTAGGEVPAEYAGPIADTADAMAGAATFDQACGGCHPGSAPELADIGWSAGAIRQQVREGGEGMPPLAASRVSDEDLENILAHMATMGAAN